MNSAFAICSSLQSLDVSNWDISKVTHADSLFAYCASLQSLDVSNWDTSELTNIRYMFSYCSQLQSLDVSNWDTSNVTGMNNTFDNCLLLQTLDVSSWNASNITSASNPFYRCIALQSLIGNRTIDDVLANNIGALNGLKIGLDLSYTILDRASLRAVINGLSNLTGQTTQTLRLGGALIAKITEEDIAIATNKNWTLS
jgi:surface protein